MELNGRHILKVSGLLMACLCVFACSPEWVDDMEIDFSSPSHNPGDRIINQESRRVMILYSAGFNNLSDYLREDIEELKTGMLPGNKRTDHVVLSYSHFPVSDGKYSEPSSPALVRLYSDTSGAVHADTLVVYDSSTISSSPAQLNSVLSYVQETFPAAGYGLVFSSHATGYLPAGFYQKPSEYIYKGKSVGLMGLDWHGAAVVPYVEMPCDPSLPAVKSMGQDQVGNYGSYVSYEIELSDFAEAIPMKLDYILFDACLMGGIEVAYELRDKTDAIGFSQTEVLAEGLDYKTITSHLLKDDPDVAAVCQDFFDHYDNQEGVYRSATVSAVDCGSLEPLAELCRELFDKYHEKIYSLSSGRVQKFYRSNHHWFYDLESILVEAGISASELDRLHSALESCIIMRQHTPSFMNSFDINVFSGFSMYLPSHGSTELSRYYKTLDWNKATDLVR